jgi:uncharacterized C2H2 Zn-finger protein
MAYFKCPVCSEVMDNEKYDNHCAERHPDFQRGWIERPPVLGDKVLKALNKIIDDADEGCD